MKYEEVCWTWSIGFYKSNGMSNGHLSSMFILVHRIAYKKILQLSELQDSSLSFIRLLWSWRHHQRPLILNELVVFCLTAPLRVTTKVTTRHLIR